MGYIGRKCTSSLWEPVEGWPSDDVQAIAMLQDLRTKDNTLSFWDATDDRSGVRDVALAFASGMTSLVDTLFFVLVERHHLESQHVSFDSTFGVTPVKDMIGRHYDAVKLTPENMAAISRAIATAVRTNEFLVRYTRRQVIDLIVEGIKSKRLSLSNLKGDLRNEVIVRMKDEA